MLLALRHTTYRRLLAAHLLSIMGTGLATISMGFLAFEVAGQGSAAILGSLFAVKISIYLIVAPFAPLIAARFGARKLLVVTDLARAGAAIMLPFVESVAAAFILIVLLQAASALFTPTYQATIPRVLTDEREYTGALALFRLTYDLETLVSPAIAGAILLILPSTALFWGTAIGFMASALLILATAIPAPVERSTELKPMAQLTRGFRLMFSLPSLRGVVALGFALAMSGSIILTLTIPIARGLLGASEAEASALLVSFGVGSILAAIVMPVGVERLGARRFMLIGISVLGISMLAMWPVLLTIPQTQAYFAVCALWLVAGGGYSAMLGPIGRVLRDAVASEDLPDVFAAQFTLSHTWWLFAYLIAGFAGSAIGLGEVATGLALASLVAACVAARLWKTSPPSFKRS